MNMNMNININKIALLLLVAATILTGCNRTEETTPERKDIVDVVFASGSIIMEKNYLITAQTEGILSNSYVTEGDSVNTNELLFRIQNDPQEAMVASAAAGYNYAESNTKSSSLVWQKFKQQHIQLKNQLTNDSVQYMRYKNLYTSNAVSKAELDKAELTYTNRKADLKTLELTMSDTKKMLNIESLNAKATYLTQQNNNDQYILKSKYSGIVLSAPKIPGELIKRGETIAQIGAGKYLAKLLISENDINKIKTAQQVQIELNTSKNKSYSAVMTKVYPAFDATEQSFIAEAEFIENTPNLKVGTQLQANIIVGECKNALVIPSKYLMSDNKVMLAKNNEEIQITTGIITSEWVEVKSGLIENDIIKLKKNGSKKKK